MRKLFGLSFFIAILFSATICMAAEESTIKSMDAEKKEKWFFDVIVNSFGHVSFSYPVMREALADKINPNAMPYGRQPPAPSTPYEAFINKLTLALYRDCYFDKEDEDMLRAFVEAGADLNGPIPLIFSAARMGDSKVVRVALGLGANPRQKTVPENYGAWEGLDRFSIFSIISKKKGKEIADFFLDLKIPLKKETADSLISKGFIEKEAL